MSVPPSQTKAKFLRTLVHQVRIRIRVLELLSDGPVAVQDLLAEIGAEAASLSQQLTVLRRADIVTSIRESGAVRYALAGPDVADLMHATHSLLAQILAGHAELLEALRDDLPDADRHAITLAAHPPGAAAATSHQRRVRAIRGARTQATSRNIALGRSTDTVAPARRAAWDTYLALTTSLLPALRTEQPDSTVDAKLGGVTIRITRYAPLWGEHGPMLTAAARSAIRLYHAGDHDDLVALLQSTADRLYLLSASRTPPPRNGRDPTTP